MKKTKTKKVYLTLMLSLMTLFCILTLSSENTYAKEKNTDVKALQSIIIAQRNKGAEVSTNLENNNQYKWSKKTGRLRGVRWSKKKLKGRIDFNKLTGLKSIEISKNNVTKINVNKLEKLETLICSKNKLNKLNIKTNKRLEFLNCSHNKINKLCIEKLRRLESIDCGYNRIKKLHIIQTKIFYLGCENNQLKALNLSKAHISKMNCAHNKLELLEVNNISWLNCSYNSIRELSGGDNSLSWLKCNNNQLTNLDIGRLFEDWAGELHCHNNNITFLDFSGIIEMRKIVCDREVKLEIPWKKVDVKRK